MTWVCAVPRAGVEGVTYNASACMTWKLCCACSQAIPAVIRVGTSATTALGVSISQFRTRACIDAKVAIRPPKVKKAGFRRPAFSVRRRRLLFCLLRRRDFHVSVCRLTCIRCRGRLREPGQLVEAPQGDL